MVEYKNIYTTGGVVQAGSGIYIKRAVDDVLLDLCRELEFVFVLSARQLGKSSLMIHTAERLARESIRSVIVDLSALGVKLSPDQWYLGILKEIAFAVKLETDIFSWWVEHNMLGQAQRLTTFFREVLLQEVDERITIFFDEIDSTLSIPFADDFFAALRAVYNGRAITPAFTRLTFVLIGVATPSDLMRNNSRTPINIGKRIELADFTLEEAMPLAAGFENRPAEALRWILEWTGGHPYLTQLLCEYLVENNINVTRTSVRLAVAQLFDGEKGRQDHNLQFVRDMLTRRSPNTLLALETYENICRGAAVSDDENSVIKAHLKISGIVISKNGDLVVRNRIYEKVFDVKWIKENSPVAHSLHRITKEDIPKVNLPIEIRGGNRFLISLLRQAALIITFIVGLSILGYFVYTKWGAYLLIIGLVVIMLIVAILSYRSRIVSIGKEIGVRITDAVGRLTNRLRRLEPKARLIAIQGIPDISRKNFDIFGETPIGRSNESAELIFDNDNVSRLHCVIHEGHAGRWTIEDMESANGTFLNGRKLIPFVEDEIESGMIIELGPVEYGGIKFLFEIVDVFSGNDEYYSSFYEESDAVAMKQENVTRITDVFSHHEDAEGKIKPYGFENEGENDIDPSDPANQKW